MLSWQNFRLASTLAVVGLAFMVALSAAPGSGQADTAKAVAAESMAASTPSAGSCAVDLKAPESSGFINLDGGACHEESFGERLSRGGRTCRCSCGYPCKTDADCGGAIGSCRGGISCC